MSPDDSPTLPPDDVATLPVIYLEPHTNTTHRASVRPDPRDADDVEGLSHQLAPDTERTATGPDTRRSEALV